MKKVLCNKDGKFLSIHDGDCTLTELNDGDCLTHEDGTIVMYWEDNSEPPLENIYFHAYYKNGSLHLPKNSSSFYDYAGCGYRFSTEKEKARVNNALSEKGLIYSEERKCLEKKRWRAKIGNSYYCINFDSLTTFQATETDGLIDNFRYNNLNYFQTKEEAEKKLFEIKAVLND